MKARLGRLLALAGLCVVASLATTAPAANAATCGPLTGSGSSLQGVAQEKVWGPAAETKVQGECSAKFTVTYHKSSSGKGMACWGVNKASLEPAECEDGGATLDGFIGTDIAPEGNPATKGTQLGNMGEAGGGGTTKNAVVAVPVAQSAVALLVTMPNECEPTSKNPGRVEQRPLDEEWFSKSGTLSKLVKIKGGWKNCGTAVPSLIVRSKPSGTTAAYKRFLAQVDATNWKPLVENASKAQNTDWPASATVSKLSGSGGEEAVNVFGTSNSMGYADLADAANAGFSLLPTKHETKGEKLVSFYVEVQNKKGEETFASPLGSDGTSSNCELAKYNEAKAVAPGEDWSVASQNNVFADEGYPVCTLTFDLAWNRYKAVPTKFSASAEETATSVLNYLQFVVTAGQNLTKLKESHYAPLKGEILSKATKGVNKTNIAF